MSDVCLQEVKFILNSVLPLCHFFWSLTRLGLCEFALASVLGFEPSLAHFDRQFATVGKPVPQAFIPGVVLKVFIGLVVQLLVVLHKVHNSLLILSLSGRCLSCGRVCLFTLYTTPLSNIISNFNVTHHLYADDTQIYLALDNRNFDSSFAELTECLTCIQNWMAGVKLKLNPEKTEFIIIGDRQARESLINKFPTQLLGNSISPTDTVKNLGVIFDSGNTFSNHITNMCRACYYHLKDLRRIRKFLSVETAALLANSMISSRLDYCNSLLYGISKYNVAKLQKIQNALCRIVFRLDRTSHVTPFLQKLHWLPITYRILFKYNLITFKAINFSQPIYLSSLIKTSCLTRGNRLSLSSASHKKAIGRRGFVVASPIEWNRLPQSVRSQQTITGFRSQLKTYLFRLAYPPP